jgi:hypothetical protein
MDHCPTGPAIPLCQLCWDISIVSLQIAAPGAEYVVEIRCVGRTLSNLREKLINFIYSEDQHKQAAGSTTTVALIRAKAGHSLI